MIHPLCAAPVQHKRGIEVSAVIYFDKSHPTRFELDKFGFDIMLANLHQPVTLGVSGGGQHNTTEVRNLGHRCVAHHGWHNHGRD
jgi:hypothetical protein